MFFSSPTSNITPALISTAMSRSDSRDSTASTSSFSSAPMHVSYSTSPATYRSSNTAITFTSRMARESFSSSGWSSAPYASCMLHRSSSSQGYESSASSSYISDDDLLALEDLPIDSIPSITSSLQREERELTTEEHILMLREQQEREQAQFQQQRSRAQQQRSVRFAVEQKKPRRSSNLSQKKTVSMPRRS